MFLALPAIYFQIRYLLVLKPDQILNKLRNYSAPQNTSLIIFLFALFLTAVLVSFLADSIIYPALTRYYYQKLGSRKPKMSQSIKDSMSISFAETAQKFFKLMVLLINLAVTVVIFYGAYVLGYGSLENQYVLYVIGGLLALVQYSLYFYFKYWLSAGIAVGYTQGRSKVALAIKMTLLHPFSALGYGLNWILSLSVCVLALLSLSWGATQAVERLPNIWQQLLALAIASTLVYLVWSMWTSWQTGYWTAIVEHKSRLYDLSFASLEESKSWQFLSLLIMLFIICGSFVLVSYMFSDKLVGVLDSLYSKIPENIQLNLPKPQ